MKYDVRDGTWQKCVMRNAYTVLARKSLETFRLERQCDNEKIILK